MLPVERHRNSARTGTTVLSRQGHDGTSVSSRAPNLPKLASSPERPTTNDSSKRFTSRPRPWPTRGPAFSLQINLYGPTRRSTLPSELQPRARDSCEGSGSLRTPTFPGAGFNLCAPVPTSEEIRIVMYALWLRRMPSYAVCRPTALKSESGNFA